MKPKRKTDLKYSLEEIEKKQLEILKDAEALEKKGIRIMPTYEHTMFRYLKRKYKR